MTETAFNYDNVKGYSLEPADQEALIQVQNECTFMWSTRDPARDPRVSISITSKGVNRPGGRSLTLKGRCEVLKDRATIDWSLPKLAERLRYGDGDAQRLFVRLNDTPNRRVLKVTPLVRIGYDGHKLRKATTDAVTSGRRIGPS